MILVSEVCFDAIHPNVGMIPRKAPPFAVGGYVNGVITRFVWTADDWDLFPHSYHIRINVSGELSRGNALDVESGDATPANIVPWVDSVKGTADPLLIYCNRSNIDACVAARNEAHDKTGRYAFMWEATLDGTISQRAMTQFSQTTVNGSAVTDVSLITDEKLIGLMAARIGLQ